MENEDKEPYQDQDEEGEFLMRNTVKTMGVLFVIICCNFISCKEPSNDITTPIVKNQTPVVTDFEINNLTQTVGSIKAVTIIPKTGKSLGAITIFYNGSTTLPVTAGSYTVTFNVSAANGWNAANGLAGGTLTINTQVNAQSPIIASQPVGSTVTINTSYSFSVIASVTDGGSLSYQWYSNTIMSNTGGTPIDDKATSASYSPPTDTVGTYYYYVEITNVIADNSNGGSKTSTVRSNVITIIIDTKVNAQTPNITVQPLGGNVILGGIHNLFVTANVTDGGSLSYQWYSNTNASNTGGTPIVNNSTSDSYIPPTGTAGTFYFYMEVTNTITDNGDGGIKSSIVTSNAVTLIINEKVNAQIPSITGQPVGSTVTINTSYIFTVTANVTDGGLLSYQWYSNTNASNTGGTLLTNNAKSASYSPPTVTAGTYYYYVEIANTITDNGDGGSKTAIEKSNAVTLIINEKVNAQTPYIASQPVGGNVVFGEVHNLSVTASVTDGGSLSYQWYSNTIMTNTGGTPLASNATSASYSLPTGNAGTYYYYVEITNTIIDNGDGGSKTAKERSNAINIVIISPSVIKINLMEMNEWNLIEQTVQTFPAVNKTFVTVKTTAPLAKIENSVNLAILRIKNIPGQEFFPVFSGGVRRFFKKYMQIF